MNPSTEEVDPKESKGILFQEQEDKSYEIKVAEKISEFSKELISKAQTYINELSDKYTSFNKNINNYIKENSNKIRSAIPEDQLKNPKIVESIEQFASKNIEKHLDALFEIHSQINQALFENFDILSKFLHVEDYLNEEEPIQEFVKSNIELIFKSWVFQKLDFTKFNLTEIFYNQKINDDLKEFVKKNAKDKFKEVKILREIRKVNGFDITNTTIERSKVLESAKKKNIQLCKNKIKEYIEEEEKRKERDIVILAENQSGLNKLQFGKVAYVENFFKGKNGQEFVFPNLKSLHIKNSRIGQLSLEKAISNCQKLIIKNAFGFESGTLTSIPNNLIRLSFDKVNFINYDLNNILTMISRKDCPLLSTLEYLSFANNYINSVDFNQFIFQNNQMKKLRELDFKKNQIYKFLFNPGFFKNLRFINVTHNNFSKSYFNFDKKTQIIALANNNMYLTNKNNNKKYLDNLKQKLKTFEYGFSFLSLSGLFNKATQREIIDVQVNYQIQLSVKKLDLSYCNLENDTIFKFFDINGGFLDLRVLNLNGNELTEEFFELYIEKELHKKFTKLKSLNFSGNNMKSENFMPVFKFIEANKLLNKIKITKNPFSKNYAGKKKDDEKNEVDRNKDKLNNQANLDFVDFIDRIREMQKVGNREEEGRKIEVKFDLNNKFNLIIDEKIAIEKKVKDK